MRRVYAALVDVVAAGLLGYGAFRLAVWSAPCGSDQGNCTSLMPLVIVLVALGLVAYFGAGLLFWESTPGERLLHPVRTGPEDAP